MVICFIWLVKSPLIMWQREVLFLKILRPLIILIFFATKLLDTCTPACTNGLTCHDGICLCGSYNGEVCQGKKPSCLTSTNNTIANDISSTCRACTNQPPMQYSETSQGGQGSCSNSEEICLSDGSCKGNRHV